MCCENSGAYILWMLAIPSENWPLKAALEIHIQEHMSPLLSAGIKSQLLLVSGAFIKANPLNNDILTAG